MVSFLGLAHKSLWIETRLLFASRFGAGPARLKQQELDIKKEPTKFNIICSQQL